MSEFKFIYFDNISNLPLNDFNDLHNEINNPDFLQNVQNFEYNYMINQNKQEQMYNNIQIKKTLIYLQNNIKYMYNDIKNFQEFLNYYLNCQNQII
jgi:hypothetical protein